MEYNYSITLKYIKQGIFATKDMIKDRYDSILLKCNGTHIDSDYELDSMGRLHIHGLFRTSQKAYIKNLKKDVDNKYWAIFLSYLNTKQDKSKWISYMHKQNSEAIAHFTDGAYYFI